MVDGTGDGWGLCSLWTVEVQVAGVEEDSMAVSVEIRVGSCRICWKPIGFRRHPTVGNSRNLVGSISDTFRSVSDNEDSDSIRSDPIGLSRNPTLSDANRSGFRPDPIRSDGRIVRPGDLYAID